MYGLVAKRRNFAFFLAKNANFHAFMRKKRNVINVC